MFRSDGFAKAEDLMRNIASRAVFGPKFLTAEKPELNVSKEQGCSHK